VQYHPVEFYHTNLHSLLFVFAIGEQIHLKVL